MKQFSLFLPLIFYDNLNKKSIPGLILRWLERGWTSLKLAFNEARVLLLSRNSKELSELNDEFISKGFQSIYQSTDVSNLEDLNNAVNYAKKQWGTVDAIINNATASPAPELIPSIWGPASGFLKRVCICRPLMERAAPAMSAVNALGILISCKIIYALVS